MCAIHRTCLGPATHDGSVLTTSTPTWKGCGVYGYRAGSGYFVLPAHPHGVVPRTSIFGVGTNRHRPVVRCLGWFQAGSARHWTLDVRGCRLRADCACLVHPTATCSGRVCRCGECISTSRLFPKGETGGVWWGHVCALRSSRCITRLANGDAPLRAFSGWAPALSRALAVLVGRLAGRQTERQAGRLAGP